MKKQLIIISIGLVAFLFSCKRDGTTPPTNPPANGQKITVKLQVNEVAAPDAKTTYDSTLYAVNIKTDNGSIYAQGLFDTKDSISIDLLRDSIYNVELAIVKRGTSEGMWWELAAGYKSYSYPVNRRLRNHMFYAADEGPSSTEVMQPKYLDTLSNMRVVTNTATNTYETYQFSELDTYFGKTIYAATDTNNTVIIIAMQRMSFAMRYDISNLALGGKIIASYDGQRRADTLTTNGIQGMRIFTADNFRYTDSVPGSQLAVTLTWIEGNGNTTVLGTMPVRPKRNVQTTIQAVLNFSPDVQYPVFSLSDTVWRGTNNYEFEDLPGTGGIRKKQ